MLNTLATNRVMALILGAVVVWLCWGLWQRSKSHTSKINIDDLFLGDDGKMSKAATVMLGSFALTTWVIVYLAITGRLNEGYFAAYLAAWVAPAVAKLIKGNDPPTDKS